MNPIKRLMQSFNKGPEVRATVYSTSSTELERLMNVDLNEFDDQPLVGVEAILRLVMNDFNKVDTFTFNHTIGRNAPSLYDDFIMQYSEKCVSMPLGFIVVFYQNNMIVSSHIRTKFKPVEVRLIGFDGIDKVYQFAFTPDVQVFYDLVEPMLTTEETKQIENARLIGSINPLLVYEKYKELLAMIVRGDDGTTYFQEKTTAEVLERGYF